MCILGVGTLFVGIMANQIARKGMPWRVLKFSLPGITSMKDLNFVPADSALTLFFFQEAVFVDVRTENDFQIDHVKGAETLPFIDFLRDPARFDGKDKSSTYVLYDFERHSRNVRLVAHQLQKNGFEDVRIMLGGFSEWMYKEYPTESGE